MYDELVALGNGAHALACQLLGNADDAADAVQDAIAKVLSSPGKYQASRGPLRPWFLRIVRNRCIDLIRQRRTSHVEIDQLHDQTDGPEQLASNQERDAAVARALATLPQAQRETIVLRDYLDLSYAEVASVLEVPKGTIMSRLHRSRLALKEALIEYEH